MISSTHYETLGDFIIGHTDDPQRGIYQGSAYDLADGIPNNSIGAIICDPVYQNLAQYRFVANLADRVLLPGRSVIAQCGHIHAFEAETLFTAPGVIRRPRLHEQFSGGWGRNWMHKAFRNSQPYLWGTKSLGEDGGDYNFRKLYHKWVRLSFWGSKDKGSFVWGDGERAFVTLVESFTNPGDVILDPFTGTGTLPAVAAKLGRKYIGFEIDPGRVQLARERLSQPFQMAMQFPEDMLEPSPEEIEELEQLGIDWDSIMDMSQVLGLEG